MNPEHYAKEAQRLLADDVLTYAFDTIRAGALEALALADADSKTAILRLQQKVAVIDEIRSELLGATHGKAKTANPAGTFA